MSRNVNRKPSYPTKVRKDNPQARAKRKRVVRGILRWAPLWIPLLVVLWFLIPARVRFHRIEHNSIKTTAHVKETYTVSGVRKCDYYVSYYFYVDDSVYLGKASLKKSVWEQLAPHDPIEIAYEKGNPSNSNWAGYHKD